MIPAKFWFTIEKLAQNEEDGGGGIFDAIQLLGYINVPPPATGVYATPSQVAFQHIFVGTHLYTWVEKDIVE